MPCSPCIIASRNARGSCFSFSSVEEFKVFELVEGENKPYPKVRILERYNVIQILTKLQKMRALFQLGAEKMKDEVWFLMRVIFLRFVKFETMCGSRKCPYPHHGGNWKFQRGGGVKSPGKSRGEGG